MRSGIGVSGASIGQGSAVCECGVLHPGCEAMGVPVVEGYEL